MADEAPGPRARPRVTRRGLVLALLVFSVAGLAAAGGLLLYRVRTDLPAPGQLAMLSPDLLRRTLLQRGVSPKDLVDPLNPGPLARALAGQVKEDDPVRKARALARVLAGRLGALSPLLHQDTPAAVRAPEELLAQLDAKAGARGGTGEAAARPSRVTSYELAATLVSLLRAAGLDALLCQQFVARAPMTSADPSGAMGRFVATVYPPDRPGQTPLARLDPVRALKLPAWAGEGGDPEMKDTGADLVPLDDASAAVHLLGLRALAVLAGDPREAYRLSELALKASAPSSTLHLLRATVLSAAGGVQDAVAEAKKAVEFRKDAPAQGMLGGLLMKSGESQVGLGYLRAAVRKDPGFWPAHLLLVMALLSSNEKEGEEHLAAALKTAPDEPAVMTLDAMHKLSTGHADQAVKTLEKVLASPSDDRTRLLYYQALRMAGEASRAEAYRTKLVQGAANPEEMKKQLEILDRMSREADEGGDSDAPAPPTASPPLPPPGSIKLPDVRLYP